MCYQWPVLVCHGACCVVIRAHPLRGDKGIEKEDAPGGYILKGRQVGVWEGGFPRAAEARVCFLVDFGVY